eukprot:6973524-Alexandrium_andersonii.AAC.1
MARRLPSSWAARSAAPPAPGRPSMPDSNPAQPASVAGQELLSRRPRTLKTFSVEACWAQRKQMVAEAVASCQRTPGRV